MVTTLLEKPAASPVVIIDLQGAYDIGRRQGLIAQLQAIASCDIAIIDMRRVTHLDATALACFVQLRKRLRESGRGTVRIVGLKPTLYRFYQTADLDRDFELFETISDAMGEYGYTMNQPHVNRCAT